MNTGGQRANLARKGNIVRVYCSLGKEIGSEMHKNVIIQLISAIEAQEISVGDDELVLVGGNQENSISFFPNQWHDLIIKPETDGHFSGIDIRVISSCDIWTDALAHLDRRHNALTRRVAKRQPAKVEAAFETLDFFNSRPQVLVVADLIASRETAKKRLWPNNQLTLVSDFVSALHMIRTQRFDLVYIDLHLPLHSGRSNRKMFCLGQQALENIWLFGRTERQNAKVVSTFSGLSRQLFK